MVIKPVLETQVMFEVKAQNGLNEDYFYWICALRYKHSKPFSKCQIMFESKASIRFKSGAYTLVREHFEPDRNAAIGHKMAF